MKNILAFFNVMDYNLYKGAQKAQIMSICVTKGQISLLVDTNRDAKSKE